jgi:hypothetical protein
LFQIFVGGVLPLTKPGWIRPLKDDYEMNLAAPQRRSSINGWAKKITTKKPRYD